ncbi:MAG: NAD(P)-binding domain-containing protein [Candidatus Promineifilaceae bacterium]
MTTPTKPTSNPNKYHHIAIIGAGPAGITAVKCLREAGLEVTAYEKSADIGGLWHYDEDAPDGGGIAYRSLKTNTSKKMTAFSDFPFPEEADDYPHRTEVLAYLNRYADHFGIRPFIRLNTTVEHITLQDDQKWLVTYQTEGRTTQNELFDAVVVASGFYQKPLIPHLPGLDDFKGNILHSADYKGPEPFVGRCVVVIGSGSSGADVAGEVGQRAEQVDLSSRTPVWFVPHFANGKPLDNNITRFSNHLPNQLRKSYFEKTVLNSYQRMGLTDETIDSVLALPEYDPESTKTIPGTKILQAAANGRVRVKGDIQKVEPDGVRYTDGSQTKADTLIFCTGYAPALPYLDPSVIRVQDTNTFGLYKLVFHPQLDNLAFLAQCRVGGPVFPVMEMQARWAAAVFTGTAELPPPAVRQKVIQAHFAACQEKGKNPMQVLYADYMNEIAGEIGVRPKWLAHLDLLKKLLFNPILPAQFRLDGPGKSDKAREIIENYRP